MKLRFFFFFFEIPFANRMLVLTRVNDCGARLRGGMELGEGLSVETEFSVQCDDLSLKIFPFSRPAVV